MISKIFTLIFAYPIFFSTVASAQLSVTKIAVGTEIVNGSLVGEGSSFGSDVATLYCLTTFAGAVNKPTIKHIWYYNGKKESSSEFVVRSGNFKTWSSKKIWRTWKGNWRVDVVDHNDKVLASTSFTIR